MEYKAFKRRINYYETDKMQVVHHSNYIRFLEECRMDFLDQLGISYDMLEKSGLMIPVLSVSCNYKMAVRYGDTICIVPKVTRFHGVKFEMSYKIYSEDFTVLHNEATSSHCFVGMDFKPVRIKKEFPDLCEKFENVVGKDLLDIE
ncbi:MAG: acyl-CoA thioesterase [Lachnospiraceae bacterium]|nr:acyl-CoA thioesterase [Lachnospiraceae bacterium]